MAFLVNASARAGPFAKLKAQLDEILAYIEKLSEVNTDNIDPVSNITDLLNIYRDDVKKGSMDVQNVLQNAPVHDDESFKVPKVF